MGARLEGLFLVLEPGNHMFFVIEAAQRRGLTVVVCHSQPVAPPAPFDRALPCISHFVPIESWRESEQAFETIVAWCGDRPVRGTYAGFEVTLRTETRLRQHYGLPGIDPAAVDFFLDKARVRDRLRDAGLTRLRVLDEAELRQLTEWPFPGRGAFLKPVNGSGSIYVRRCTTLADIHAHLAEWDGNARHMRRFVAEHLRGRGLFLEEEAVGELLSVEGYCYDGHYVPVGITDRTVLARDIAVEMGNTFPCPHPRRDAIIAKARAVHEALGIAHGATHTELIVPLPEGDIELVELNMRFAGGDILILIDRALDTRFEDDLVALAVGQAPQTSALPAPRCYASGQDLLAPATTTQIDAIEIPGDDVFFQKILVKPGAALKSTNFQNDHVAAFVVSAATYAGAIARSNEVRAQATINGHRLGDDPNNVVINYADRWT
jgi:biotin carboxylase